MQIGCTAKITILSASYSEGQNGTKYYRLAILGTDGEAGNIDCSEDVYNKVSNESFPKMRVYNVDCSYRSGQTSKGRYQFLQVIGIANEVK